VQNKVLIVDGDTRSLRLLEVSLKQAGYRVVTATSGLDALSQLEVEVPDLVLADTAIGEVDGFALCSRLQQRPEWAHLPLIFILDGEDATQKLRAVQLGVSDFLSRPVFLKEVLSRVELLLEKQAQRGEGASGQAPTSGRARFSGALSGTALLDLLQTMELGRKSGIAYCTSARGQRAVVYFAEGVVVDAELGRLRGLEALYRILTFQGGEYRVELLTVVRPPRIELGAAGLLMEAMRFLEEWNRLGAALPPLTSVLLPAPLAGAASALRPELLPGELREVLQLFDGQRSVLEVLELLDEQAEPPPDLLARLGAVAKLYAARLLTLAGRPVSGEPRATVPTPLAVPRLIPPAARLTPPPLPRLTPPPLPRLTPPPLPRLTPPPLLAGRAAALASLGRPTPVSLPRAVVKTPAPLPAPAAVTLPTELLITLVPEPPPSAGPLPGSSAEAATDESPTPLPLPFPPAARATPVAQLAIATTAPLNVAPPSAAGPDVPLSQQAVVARVTPPPLPIAESSRLAPAASPAGRSLTPAPHPEAAPLPPAVPDRRLTPPPLPGHPAVHLAPAAATSPRLDAADFEAAAVKQTLPGGGRLTPPPAYPAAHLPPAAATSPRLTAADFEAAAVKQTLPGGGRLTPPPLPAPAAATSPRLDAADFEAAAVKQTLPGGGRLTPPPLPGHPAVHLAPAAATSPRLDAADFEAAAVKQTLPGGGRLTPPPLLAREAAQPMPAGPRPTPPPSLEETLAAMESGWLTPEMLSPEPSAPALLASARSTPPPLPDLTASRQTPVLESRVTPPPLPDEVPSSLNPEAEGPSESHAAPGNNLARLAQRLAATRQPLPFVPPILPSSVDPTYAGAPGGDLGFAVARSAAGTYAGAPGSDPGFASAVASSGAAGYAGAPGSDPGFASAVVQMTATGESSSPGAGPGRSGPVPELEPISIPEFELMIEHSAPSWLPAPGADHGARPGGELQGNKTLPVQLRSQYRAAAVDTAPAVHLSPPRLPAAAAADLMPPIEVDAPAAPRLIPPPARGPLASNQRWGKAVAWAVAGTALFSLGVGLYWVRQELDRGITIRGPKGAPPAAVAPERQPAEPLAARPPTLSQPTSSQPVAPPAGDPAAAGQQASPLPAAAVATPAPPAAQPPPQAPAAATNGARPSQSPDPAETAIASALPSGAASAAAPAAASASAGEFATLIGKARAFEHRGALTPAYHAAHAAQRLQPRSSEVFAILAQLALDQGNADKAAGLAKRARYLDARNADAYLVLGTVEQARSHPASARAYFKKYLALAPSGERAVEVRAVLRSSR
jgi:CheY-like chemotaxis protein